MTIPTTRQVWSALPYSARRVLIPDDLPDCEGVDALDLDVWTSDRIMVTPWTLLPQAIRDAIHGMVTCEEQDEV